MAPGWPSDSIPKVLNACSYPASDGDQRYYEYCVKKTARRPAPSLLRKDAHVMMTRRPKRVSKAVDSGRYGKSYWWCGLEDAGSQQGVIAVRSRRPKAKIPPQGIKRRRT